MAIKVILRGGGDLASGAAVRMFRTGMQVVVCELPRPYAVRRTVSFADVVYSKEMTIENIHSFLADNTGEVVRNSKTSIPVIIDAELNIAKEFQPNVVVDGRMLKQAVSYEIQNNLKVIGLGPGFVAGVNCHAAVETRRGPNLGRVYWEGSTEEDTGIPEVVRGVGSDRVIRATRIGVFFARVKIGDIVAKGQEIGEVNGHGLLSPIDGVVRGLLHDSLDVVPGLKIGDIDPRMDPSLILKISDKALAVGGGVVEAILSLPELRSKLAN